MPRKLAKSALRDDEDWPQLNVGMQLVDPAHGYGAILLDDYNPKDINQVKTCDHERHGQRKGRQACRLPLSRLVRIFEAATTADHVPHRSWREH